MRTDLSVRRHGDATRAYPPPHHPTSLCVSRLSGRLCAPLAVAAAQCAPDSATATRTQGLYIDAIKYKVELLHAIRNQRSAATA